MIYWKNIGINKKCLTETLHMSKAIKGHANCVAKIGHVWEHSEPIISEEKEQKEIFELLSECTTS